MCEVAQYDYALPQHLIAQSPTACRSDARLMIVDRQSGSLLHRHIRDLPEILRPEDCLVVNDTRVVPARLVGYRTGTKGRWEALFLEADPHGFWRLMCKTRGRLVPGESITLQNRRGEDDLRLTLAAKQADGSWIARPDTAGEPLSLLERVGRVPLPPYIRKGEMVESDQEDYQTVFADKPGAIAAPTAGLHFTKALMGQMERMGFTICRLTLHVGSGTFRPIATESLADHEMHAEWGGVAEACVQRIAACRERGGRVVAVGTTCVRLLETAAADGTPKPFCGWTNLFIRPPYQFRATDVLLTNFHLPRTTLLVLARTFGGEELTKRAYEEAIREEYRFFSYGDAMLIL